jgi:hypothetical protein
MPEPGTARSAPLLAACVGAILYCVLRTEWSADNLLNEFRFVWMVGALLYFGHAALIVLDRRAVQIALAVATTVYSLLLVELGRLGELEAFLCPALFVAVAVASVFGTSRRSENPGRGKFVVLAILAAIWFMLTLGAFGLAYALADRQLVPEWAMSAVPIAGVAGLAASIWFFLRRTRRGT